MLGKTQNPTHLRMRRAVAYSSDMPRTTKPTRASDRARARLREELAARGIGQQALADALTALTGDDWTKSKVNHVLNGHVQLLIDEADAIANVCKLYLTEVVRDRGLEFYAEMTPTELRILERLRQRPNLLQAIMLILDIAPVGQPDLGRPARPKRGRPLNSEIQKKRA